jgi:hypothetical protein
MQCLANLCAQPERRVIIPRLDQSDRLPGHSHQLSELFLRHVRFDSGYFDFLVFHALHLHIA